ncbi:tyrosine-type recombinase/integrase [uncultured Acetatifactor sp.]|jgi:integrase/recombinase XerD|uniref:tyrosine-type recombinase/integrase n=2 Tax=uncultured Acetatifactor sp. TaxID=1671927 RepID=UPI0026391628|nr:tyrosine-type recombinase/integrase [uncultured Acetatifactor sp.]
MELTADKTIMERFESRLKEEEKSRATIEKYLRDAKAFAAFLGDAPVTKDAVIRYKSHLSENYAVASANSMLAAVNSFLRFLECADCVVRTFKVQKAVFRSRELELSRNEYVRLVETAKRRGNRRLCLVMQTICATGIRISELPFVTVESLHTRRARVSLKGKTRTVILPMELCRELKRYVKSSGIQSGSVFVTRGGRPMDRSNILHAMKALCQEAGVAAGKVFPHNLRHLFAVTYYNVEKDICHLADLLGHSNVNTTRIYTLISCEMQEQRLDGLGLVLIDTNTA